MQHHHITFLLTSVLFGRLAKTQGSAINEALSASYAPITVECPSNIQWIRSASGLGKAEAEWVSKRKPVVLDALEGYLDRLDLRDFDVCEFSSRLRQSNYEHVPTLGMAISGGGYRSGYTGTGAIRALDSRLPASNKEKTGGLLQSLTYLTGQSGGAWPVASFPTQDYPTTDELVETWISQQTAQDALPSNSTAAGSYDSIFADLYLKKAAGFNISASDFFGRDFAYEFLPGAQGGLNVTWSGITNQSKFLSHEMPMSMLQATALEADDLVYYGYQTPFDNSTVYEFTPFEFGSWDSRVGAFTPMEWTGTHLAAGTPVNKSACIRGFDRASFLLGTVASAFNFWSIEDDSNGTLAQWPKRSIDNTAWKAAKKMSKRDGVVLFPEATLEEIAGAFEEVFNLTPLNIAYSHWPNPFAGSSTGSASSTSEASTINFVDSSEAGTALPLSPLLQPARNLTFIMAWDDDADALPYNWNNGTSLYNAYLIANASGLPFPIIPPVNTMLNRNYSLKPTLFGCDTKLTTTKSAQTPIILYMTGSPYSAYTNYTWTSADGFGPRQFNEILVNSFNLLTQGNGTLDSEWTTCLGCAVIDRSLEKIGMKRTEQCEKCLTKHCWDGTYDETPVGIMDPSLLAYPDVSFVEWNITGYW